MNQTQRSIVFYAILSFTGLMGAVLIAMVLAMAGASALRLDWLTNDETMDRVVWAAMALTVILWLPFNLWCRRQIRCATCQRSLFQTFFQADWDFGEGRWASNVRTACPRCKATLS